MNTLAMLGGAHIHTPGFVKRLNAREGVTVKSVWDHDADRAQARAEALGASVVAKPEDVCGDEEIEAVVICSETNRHEDLVLAAAAAGKHMFVEKPLGVGARDSFRMAAAIEKAGVLFQTGYFMRGSPVHQFLKNRIEDGVFGEISRVRHANCHAGSLKGWFDTQWRWMADPSQAGCGAYGDLGTHSLDILMWWLGDVEAVCASVHTLTNRYPDCDEFGEALIRFKSGVLATLAAGWVDAACPVKTIVSGTEGHAYVANKNLYFQSSKLENADGAEPWTELPDALPHAFELWLDAVAGKPDVPLVSAHEAAARSAVMEAIYRAAEKQTWVAPEQP